MVKDKALKDIWIKELEMPSSNDLVENLRKTLSQNRKLNKTELLKGFNERTPKNHNNQ